MPNQSQHVLVTGASRGLGLATAICLAKSGFSVWAGVRKTGGEELATACRENGVSLRELALDVTDDKSVEAAVDRIGSEAGGLSGLINNAGITARCPFEDFPEPEVRRIFEVNIFGTMRVTRRVLPLLRQIRGSRIVMVSSIGGRIGSMSVAPYVSSKFAVEGFAESLYLELKPLGIHVSIVEPGIVKTSIWGENRILTQAFDTTSPYHDLFWTSERLTEKVLNSSTLQPAAVAEAVLKIMTARNPRLRTVVGRRAALILSLRKHIPGELFEKWYFGSILRHVTRSAKAGTASARVGAA